MPFLNRVTQHKLKACYLFLLLSIHAQTSLAADAIIPLIKPSAVIVDANDNEPAWATAPTYSLDYEISPGDLQKTNIKTTAKIFHDGQFLYVLVQATDAQPDKIKANQSLRDTSSGLEDRVTLTLDPLGNGRRAINLRVNAAGVQSDFISSSFGDSSYNWNGEWQSFVSKNQSGYTVEYKIPFSTLQVQPDSDGSAKVKWNILRQMGRDRGEQVSIAAIEYRKTCHECQALPSQLSGVEALGSQLRLNPYIIASQSYARDSASGELAASKQVSDLGLDGIWKISPKDKLVFTLNPDYAQIEADSIQFQVNQRFARSFSERRAFFNEDSGFYSGLLPLVYTRAMVDPDYGLQYIRRDGNLSLGAFYVSDAATSFILPSLESSRSIFLADNSENLVLRSTYKPGDALLVGAMLTLREGDNGYSNRVLSTNLNWTVSEQQTFEMQLANSSSQNSSSMQQAYSLPEQQQGSAASFSHSYNGKYYGAYTRAEAYEDNFRADLGRINQVGLWSAYHSSYLQYKAGKESVFEYLNTGFSIDTSAGLAGEKLSTDRAVFFNIGWKNQTNLGVGFNSGLQAYQGVEFTLQSVYAYVSAKPSDALTVSLSVSQGDAFDYQALQKASDKSAGINASYSFKSKWELSFSASRYQFEAPAGTQINDGFYLSGNYHFNLKHHLKLIGSYGAYSDNEALNLPGNIATNKAAQYQLSYQYKPSAFKYFIAGVSSAANNANSNTILETTQVYAFSKLVWEF